MNQPNIDKWIYGIRKIMNENGVDDSDLSDDQCIEILAGLFVPLVEDCQNKRLLCDVGNNPFSMMYLKSILSITKPKGEMFEGLDIELLRAKLNTN